MERFPISDAPRLLAIAQQTVNQATFDTRRHATKYRIAQDDMIGKPFSADRSARAGRCLTTLAESRQFQNEAIAYRDLILNSMTAHVLEYAHTSAECVFCTSIDDI